MRDGLSRLSRRARAAAGKLPRPAREALRRLLGKASSDWVGRDLAQWVAASTPPLALENRHEVVFFGSPQERSAEQASHSFALGLAEAGHRVFRVASGRRDAGDGVELRQERDGLYSVSLRRSADAFASLDAIRRDLAFGATVSAVEDPAWLPVAERFARERAWARTTGATDPEALASAFPRISIVVVTYDNRDLNRLCLESLRARTEWPNIETIVVDNGSTDGTRELLTEAARGDPRMRLILNESNRGFAAACNAGLDAATGQYLVLLNNDTVVTRGWATALVRHLCEEPRLGLVGPVTNAIANAARVDVGYTGMRDLPAWAAAWTRAHDGETFEIPMLALFCAALSRSVFEKVGRLDERFGIGMFEDDDYCRRVRDAGYTVACATDAFVHHWQLASFRRMPHARYLAIYRENRKKYAQKWGAAPRPAQPSSAGARPARGADAPQQQQLSAVLERVRASRGAVIFLPSIGWQTPLLQRPHHLARVFARKGHVSIFDGSNASDRIEGFQEIEPNLFLFGGDEALLHAIPSPWIWALPYNFPLAGSYPRGARIVYDWIDDLSVFPVSRRTLARNHARALGEASLVATVSRALHDEALASRKDALYLPNGVEYERFSAPALPPRDEALDRFLAGGGPVAGYYGALASWFDDRLVARAAALRPDWRFLLIGPRLDGGFREKRTLAPDNVLWLGPRDYFALPGYLSLFDVATIPFQINAITRATSPLKLYEYFAGGKPVVATPMPECQAFPEVAIGRDALEFTEALDRMREKGRDPLFVARLRELGRANSWEARVDAVLERLAP